MYVCNMVSVFLPVAFCSCWTYSTEIFNLSRAVGLLCWGMSLPNSMDHVIGSVNLNFYPIIHRTTQTFSWEWGHGDSMNFVSGTKF